jgi:histone H1/5
MAAASSSAARLARARKKIAAQRAALVKANPAPAKSAPKGRSKPKKATGKKKNPTRATRRIAMPVPVAAPPLSPIEVGSLNAKYLHNPAHRSGTPFPAVISARGPSKENPVMEGTYTEAQMAALARARGQLTEKQGSKPKSKSKSKAAAKPKSASKPKPKSKSKPKTASRPRSAPGSTTVVVQTAPAPAAAPRKPRKPAKAKAKAGGTKPPKTPKKKSRVAKARTAIKTAEKALTPKPRKKPAGKTQRKPPKYVHPGKYQDKHGHALTLHSALPNPAVSFKQMAFGIGGALIGIAAANLADRFVATRTPEKAEKALSGVDAAKAIRGKADGYRLLTSGGSAFVLTGAGFLLRHKTPNLAYGVGGLGVGFLAKFVGQVFDDVVMPMIFKVDAKDAKWAESLSARLYPDRQDDDTNKALGLLAAPRVMSQPRYGYMPSPYRPGYPAGVMAAPQFGGLPFGGAPADSRPAGAGTVGCGGGCRPSPQDLRSVFPMPGLAAAQTSKCGCSTCGTTPRGVVPPQTNGGGVPVPPGSNGYDTRQPGGNGSGTPAQPGGNGGMPNIQVVQPNLPPMTRVPAGFPQVNLPTGDNGGAATPDKVYSAQISAGAQLAGAVGEPQGAALVPDPETWSGTVGAPHQPEGSSEPVAAAPIPFDRAAIRAAVGNKRRAR